MSKPLVSFVLASRNEVAMLVMTVLSAVEALVAAKVSGEVVVVDNSDEDVYESVKICLQGQTKRGQVRLIHETTPSIALATDRAHREARGRYLFYMDAHCLVGAKTLGAMLDFFRRHEGEPIGFLHAPIQWAHQGVVNRRTHFCVDRTKLGEWKGADCVRREQKVTWKGMPHMIRKEVYEAMGGLGCCAEHQLSWGIMRYLGMKPWLLGYENWAIPDGVVYHFGEWPKEAREHTQYRHYTDSGNEKPGTAMAVAAYVYGGEQFLLDEWECSGLDKYLKTPEEALQVAKRIGGQEREWLLANQKTSLAELYANPPWIL